LKNQFYDDLLEVVRFKEVRILF